MPGFRTRRFHRAMVAAFVLAQLLLPLNPAAGSSAQGGAQLWVARYSGPGYRGDDPSSMAVAPDGTKVFVTGRSRAATTARSLFSTGTK